MKIKELMTSPVITIDEESTLRQAASKMIRKKIGCLPVVNDKDEIIGILSESDFIAKSHSIPFSRYDAPQLFGTWLSKDEIKRMYEEASKIRIGDVMTKNVITVSEEDTVEHLVNLLIRHGFYRFPVVRGKIAVGMVSKRDFLKLIVSD